MTILEVDDAGPAAAAALRRGACIGVPTDTVYGVAAALSVPAAVARLGELKGRPRSVPIAVLVADLDQARQVGDLDGEAEALAGRHWPGPLTLVVAGVGSIGTAVGSVDGSVGVRCPDHGFLRALAREVGPLATTSANRHGEPPATTACQVADALATLELVVDGGRCDDPPSTVVDTRVSPFELLRRGGLDLA